MAPRNRRIIDLSILENNMRAIRSAVPSHAKVMAVVKADGYGHGALETAESALCGGADMLAVASVGEGIQLRGKGITAPILVLGAALAEDVPEGIKYDLIQTVCSADMVRWCEKEAAFQKKQTEVHLKTDTGMGRIGVRDEKERDSVLDALHQCGHVRLTGVFTHFSDADGGEDGIQYTCEQYERFMQLTAPLPDDVLRHCSNSAAIQRFPGMSLDIVRAGIVLYGYPPVASAIDVHPCMSWNAQISYIKSIPAGTCVSYGRTYAAQGTVRAATVTCGYADGYFRGAGPRGYVLINGKRAKILGRVCMDQMIVDISDIEHVSAGDVAVIMGKSGSETITADDIASWADTISYEILCSAGSRVERIYLH